MRRQSPAPGTHYASTNLRNALHHSSSNSVLYPVSTPLASLQKHQPGAAGGIIRHERTSNPPVQVSFVPRESADLDDDDSGDLSDDDLDQNNNDARHISTIKIGSSSEGLQKFAPMQPPKQFTSRIDAAAWGSDVDRVDHARKKGGYAVGGLRSGGFEKRHGTESRGERERDRERGFILRPRERGRLNCISGDSAGSMGDIFVFPAFLPTFLPVT